MFAPCRQTACHLITRIAGTVQIAFAALLIKMACAAAGFMLGAAYLYRGIGWSERSQQATWRGLATLAATALTAAAFLRWSS